MKAVVRDGIADCIRAKKDVEDGDVPAAVEPQHDGVLHVASSAARLADGNGTKLGQPTPRTGQCRGVGEAD